jgi:hypothetical protein
MALFVGASVGGQAARVQADDENGLSTRIAFTVDEVYPAEKQTWVHLRKVKMWDNFDHVSKVQANYLSSIVFEPPAPGKTEGVARLGNTVKLVTDQIHDSSHFFPVVGEPLFVQFMNSYLESGSVFACDGKGRQDLIAKFSQRPTDPDYGTYAVTRSGSAVLIVSGDNVKLWKPKALSAVEDKEDAILSEMRRKIVALMGTPGEWFLTNDERYVVILPPHDITDANSGRTNWSPTPPEISVNNVKSNLFTNAFIYDRNNRRLTTFAKNLHFSRPVIDAEDVAEHLQLVYQREPVYGVEIEVDDTSGAVLATHKIESKIHQLRYAGWNPSAGQLWFRSRETHESFSGNYPLNELLADNVLVRWNITTNEEHPYRLTVTQIRSAIESADYPNASAPAATQPSK